jgi:hypothetical protein
MNTIDDSINLIEHIAQDENWEVQRPDLFKSFQQLIAAHADWQAKEQRFRTYADNLRTDDSPAIKCVVRMIEIILAGIQLIADDDDGGHYGLDEYSGEDLA